MVDRLVQQTKIFIRLALRIFFLDVLAGVLVLRLHVFC